MRRLYLQIYVAFLGIVLLFAVLMALVWLFVPSDARERGQLDGFGEILTDSLPATLEPSALQVRLDTLAARLEADLTVRASGGALLAASGEPVPAPPPRQSASGWLRGRGGPVVALRLADGRWLLARWHHRRRATGLLIAVAALAGAIALGAYPLARRITRRLERLQARVEALGAGDLKARVEVEGHDEVGELARSFNQAAERIEHLVGGHKTLLAHVSHELRTPLARMRMALELLPGNERPELKRQIGKDIGELDQLIDELLLASRLDALDRGTGDEDVDLLALAAEEAGDYGAEVYGEAFTIRGDARLLRRLLHNLLQNARRYAKGSRVEVQVRRNPSLGGALLTVADRGPGVPADSRQRIFEPFYRLPGSAENGEGVGLGLALVQQIAQRHGGRARCLAREGGGTVIEVELPGVAASAAQTSLRQA